MSAVQYPPAAALWPALPLLLLLLLCCCCPPRLIPTYTCTTYLAAQVSSASGSSACTALNCVLRLYLGASTLLLLLAPSAQHWTLQPHIRTCTCCLQDLVPVIAAQHTLQSCTQHHHAASTTLQLLLALSVWHLTLQPNAGLRAVVCSIPHRSMWAAAHISCRSQQLTAARPQQQLMLLLLAATPACSLCTVTVGAAAAPRTAHLCGQPPL